MTLSCSIKHIPYKLIAILCISILTSNIGYAQDGDDEEVYLSFRYRGVIDNVVISFYKNDEFYLPVSELFTALNIDQQLDLQELTITGGYLANQTPYSLNLKNNTLTLGDRIINLQQEDFLIKDFDFFIRASLFNEIFKLGFFVDFNNLTLELETTQEIPILAKVLRARKRRLADQNRFEREVYPLKYGRERKFIDAGFLDYNFSGNFSEVNVLSYSSNLGLQLIGGDLQGTLFGSRSENFSNFETNNLRWRYSINDNPLLTNITVGQTNSNGLIQSAYTGVRLTNQPLEARVLFDEYIIVGQTSTDSEVELYLNNLLVDFQKVDGSGNYRFSAPMSYGTSQYDIRIFGPTGQVQEQTSRIQVPFTFLPTGDFNYNLNVGQLDAPIIGSLKKDLLFQGNAMYGLSNWLTAQVGAEYIDSHNEGFPTLSGKLSSRLLSNYIVSLEAANKAFLRSSISAVYANSASFRFDYTSFLTNDGIYNVSGDDETVIASGFYPFLIGGRLFNMRASTFTRLNGSGSSSTVRLDLNSRVGRFNLRAGYSDRLTDTFNFFANTNLSVLSFSNTYNFSRSKGVPSLLKGAFVRTKISFLPSRGELEAASATFSRNIFGRGRIQASYSRNFITQFNSLRLSLVIDFNKFRSNSTVTTSPNSYGLSQNIRGSIGFDSNHNNFLFSSREQVGRSGTSIKLFVDNNGDGVYDESDDLMDEKAVRVDRIGSNLVEKNGVLYFTQMKPYFQYNMEVNLAAIKNPLIVPDLDKFSVVTDPNRFKSIEIPFYMSGVIEGAVNQVTNDKSSGVAGLKLLLVNKKNNTSVEVRTYSDGSFYEYPIKPGEYELRVDQSQLDILEVKSYPEKIEFDVNAIPEGDFVEGLSFTLRPLDYIEEIEQEDSTALITSRAFTQNIREDQAIIQFENKLADNLDMSLRYIIMAQNAFYNKDIEQAFTYVSESIKIFETAQAYALRGTLYYFKGNKTEAINSWETAVRFDPDINIPNIETLDNIVNTGTLE